MVWPAYQAARSLRAEGIRSTVINARFVKPLDTEAITDAICRSGRLIIAEENVRKGGFGSGVMEMLADKKITDIQIRHFGIPDHFIEHGAPEILRKICELTSEDFLNAARELLKDKNITHDHAEVIR
jgi:1-deoxy-D-xylulose-5-phosphate synthase